jgi:hypothetical protein
MVSTDIYRNGTMMKKLAITALTTTLLTLTSINLYAAEVCKVSMMGRVCFEEGSPEATAAHMKGDAVADSAKRKVAENDVANKKDDSSNKKLAVK